MNPAMRKGLRSAIPQSGPSPVGAFFDALMDNRDPCSFMVFAGILLWLGNMMVREQESARAWGKRLGAVGFLLYMTHAALRQRPTDGVDFVRLTIGGAISGAVIMALVWISLPLVIFLWSHTVGRILTAVEERKANDRRLKDTERARRREDEQRVALEADRRRATEQAEGRRREQERQQREQAEARRQHEDALRAEREAAREHLRRFYAEHRQLLQRACPPALLEALVHSTMPDSLEPAQLWKACRETIEKLHADLLREDQRHEKENQRRAMKTLRIKNIDAEIAACQLQITNLQEPGLIDQFQDEVEGLRERIRRLELEKEEQTLLQEELP